MLLIVTVLLLATIMLLIDIIELDDLGFDLESLPPQPPSNRAAQIKPVN
jgi:hypothetical protein